LASSTLRRTLRLDGADTAEVSRGPRSGLTARTIQGEHDGDVDRDSAKGRWVGYLLTPASLILLGGSLGDRFGRRRIFAAGAGLFAAGARPCAE
jgi:hypothetical protein